MPFGPTLIPLLLSALFASPAAQQETTRGILGAPRDTLGLKPPAGARVLLARGRAPSGLCMEKQLATLREKGVREAELAWDFDPDSGVLTIVPGQGDVCTLDDVRDFRLHLEFATPHNDNPWGNNGNSGVYIQRRYEVQILNSFGRRRLTKQDCGSLYRQRLPDVNASRPAGAWQGYDIAFRAARWEEGEKVENARITVYHNGRVIHDDVEVPNKTGAGRAESPAADVIRLQDHGNAVRFRNVWILPLD